MAPKVRETSRYHSDPEYRAQRIEYSRKRYERVKNDPDYIKKRKAAQIKYLYGISFEDYTAMTSEQNNCCGLCGCPSNRLVVDHCHKTGRVRKLLCFSCNNLIGLAKDDPDLLRRAATYVESFSSHVIR